MTFGTRVSYTEPRLKVISFDCTKSCNYGNVLLAQPGAMDLLKEEDFRHSSQGRGLRRTLREFRGDKIGLQRKVRACRTVVAASSALNLSSVRPKRHVLVVLADLIIMTCSSEGLTSVDLTRPRQTATGRVQ
uniref:Uncharacterized protein n=1 Tax=Ascaris lumbricoides TaxID=6252 RepID=A0A0M3I6I8_ASCLU